MNHIADNFSTDHFWVGINSDELTNSEILSLSTSSKPGSEMKHTAKSFRMSWRIKNTLVPGRGRKHDCFKSFLIYIYFFCINWTVQAQEVAVFVFGKQSNTRKMKPRFYVSSLFLDWVDRERTHKQLMLVRFEKLPIASSLQKVKLFNQTYFSSTNVSSLVDFCNSYLKFASFLNQKFIWILRRNVQ